MWFKSSAFRVSKAIALVIIIALMVPAPAFAQFFSDDYEEESYWDSESGFVESDELFDESSDLDQNYSEGGRFVDEEQATIDGASDDKIDTGVGITISTRRSQVRLQGEQAALPKNISWGAGTGLLIGGWFALIQNSDDRTTQRSIGVGIVLGTALGAFLGLKTALFPESPQAAMLDAPVDYAKDAPLVSTVITPKGLQLGLTLRF